MLVICCVCTICTNSQTQEEYEYSKKFASEIFPLYMRPYENKTSDEKERQEWDVYFKLKDRDEIGSWKKLVVHRPNHAYLHGLREGRNALNVLNLLYKSNDRWVRRHKKQKLFYQKIEMAAMFMRIGRSEERNIYPADFQRGAEFFRQSAEKLKLFESKDELNDFAAAISYNERSDDELKDYAKNIYSIIMTVKYML